MIGLSIIVTYYKGEKFIFKCLDSIINSHQASIKKINYEIILVIDSMDDAEYITGVIQNKYLSTPINIIRNAHNIGVSASRNIGLENKQFDFYTIIDQDDYVKHDYFTVLTDELDITIPVHIINGTILDGNRNIEVPFYFFEPKFNFTSLLLKQTYIYTPGLLIFNSLIIPARNLFIDTSEKYKGCDDWAAYLNVLLDSGKKINQKFIDKLLFTYCLHTENYSNNKEEMIRSSIAVINFLSNKNNLTETNKRQIQRAKKMQSFYYDKEIGNLNVKDLFLSHVYGFLWHYFLSFFSKARLNTLVLKTRSALKINKIKKT